MCRNTARIEKEKKGKDEGQMEEKGRRGGRMRRQKKKKSETRGRAGGCRERA